MKALRYHWWERLADMGSQRSPASFNAISNVIAFGEWFTSRYGDWAEMAGIQPAHILKYPSGLAWRVAMAWQAGHWSVVCFPRQRHLVADMGGHLMVYRFDVDGSVHPVFGADRAEILGAQIALIAQEPAHIQRARSHLARA